MTNLFAPFGFFASGLGLLTIGALLALIILIWDWRYALAGVFAAQLGISVVLVRVQGVPAQWAVAQTLVMGLACVILALSASQVPSRRSLCQAGTWPLRLSALLLVGICWRVLGVNFAIPATDLHVAQLFNWTALCALVILGLGDSPLVTGIAVLLWCAVVQGIVMVVTPIPALVAATGVLELLLALACSYLYVAERASVGEQEVNWTDITFPEGAPVETGAAGQTANDRVAQPLAPALPAGGQHWGGTLRARLTGRTTRRSSAEQPLAARGE